MVSAHMRGIFSSILQQQLFTIIILMLTLLLVAMWGKDATPAQQQTGYLACIVHTPDDRENSNGVKLQADKA